MLILASALLVLAVGPQLLTYVLSGLTGAASAPKYITEVGTVAIWSIVKFAAGLGGVLTAEPFVALFVNKPFTFAAFFAGFRYTMIAFTYAALYIFFTESFVQKAKLWRSIALPARHFSCR